MKCVKPMIKAIFSQASKGLLLLSLAGCSQTLTNVTPQIAQRNPSNMYRFTTRCNVDPGKVIPGSFQIDLIIDGERHPLQMETLTPAFYFYDHTMSMDRTNAKYYFELNYQQNNRGKLKNFVVKTPLSEFQIQERCCFCLDNERGPVGAEMKVLGRGFSEGDRVILGEYNAPTSYISENVLSFQIPPVIAGKTYPVYTLCNGDKNFVGNLLVDNSRFSVEPKSLELSKGEKTDLLIEASCTLNTDLYVNVTTDIPDSVIMPEVRIHAGESSTHVTIEGGESGKGSLFIAAQGFDELEVPIQITDELEEEEK